MKLEYITCSDPREHNSISEIIKLGRMPNAEIAVQCHPSKMSDGMARNVWFGNLLKQLYDIKPINLAIHINNEWANEICCEGKIPEIILDWLKAYNTKNAKPYPPLIQRIQINMPEYTAQNIRPDLVAQIINAFPHREFIFQYNEITKGAIRKLHDTGVKFSLLFDASGGRGLTPESWQKPIYQKHKMGYSGGISPDNVIDNLRKINILLPKDYNTWIDAEGRLKTNNLFDEKLKFDTQLARLYIARANNWQKYK